MTARRRVSLEEGYRRALLLKYRPQQIGNIFDDVGDWIKDAATDVGHAFAEFGRALGDAFDGPWDAFEATVVKSIKSFKVNSVQDALSVIKTVATGGAAPLADGGVAALNDFVFSKLMPYARYIAEGFGGCIGTGRSYVGEHVEQYLKDRGANAAVARLGKEFALANYDLITGYPPCMCEEGCISNVSKGLKEAGGIPGIIGMILWYLWPIMQGRPSKDIKIDMPGASPCLYWYATGGQFLLNAQLGESGTKAVGSVLKYVNEDAGKKFADGMPQSFSAYEKYLVDLVARGYNGPEAMGGKGRNARYYFERPAEAAKVIADSQLISNLVDKVAKYVSWISTAVEVGGKVYDLYESQGSGDFDPASIDAADVMALAGRFVDKGRNLVESAADKYARELKDKLDLGGIADAYAQLFAAKKKLEKAAKQKRAFRESVPKISQNVLAANAQHMLKAGSIVKLAGLNFGAVDAQAVMSEWQPAQIGLAARQRWNHMVWAWAHMTEAERAKLANLDEGTNEQTWASTGINYNGQHGAACGIGEKSWYHLLTTDKRALQAIYNFNLPGYYVEWLRGALQVVDAANPAIRAQMRAGTTGLVPNPARWVFKIPEVLVPSPRDVTAQAKGWSATPEQYALWVNDLRDLYDPRRWKASYERAHELWTHGLLGSPESWRKDTPSGASNPPLMWRAPVLGELAKVTVTLNGKTMPLVSAKVTGGYLTYKSFWSLVMDAGKVGTWQEALSRGLQAPAVMAPDLTSGPLTLPPISTAVLQAGATAAMKVAKLVAEDPETSLGGETSSKTLWWILGGIGVAALIRLRLAND